MRVFPEQTISRVMKPLLFFICIAVATVAMAQTPPSALDDTVKMCEGTAITINILANDTDPDLGEVLEVDILSGPSSALIDYEDGEPEGEYTIFVDPGFTGEDAIIYEVCGEDDLCDIAVIVIIVAGAEGCVWPGDANVDSACNVIDLLPIGIYYGTTGPDRDDDDGTWEESFCDEWEDSPDYIISPNPKFADCNGDGLVDAQDTVVIVNNYGQLHGGYAPVEYIGAPGDPLLSIDFFADTIEAGSEVVIPIMLGTAAAPASNIYGIAFQLDYDETLIVPGSIRVTFNSGWLGLPGTDLLSLTTNDTVNGRISASVTRINQLAISGNGNIGEVGFVMEDNIAGKTTGIFSTTLNFCIEQPLTVNTFGEPLPVQVACDSVVAFQVIDDVNDFIQQHIQVFPNPADEVVKVQFPESISGIIELHNMMGEKINTEIINSNSIIIKTGHLPGGTYVLMARTDQSVFTQRIIVQH